MEVLTQYKDKNGINIQVGQDEIEIKVDLRNVAEQEGLDIIETTTGTNGYPENLKFAITGFDTFEQAQDLADKYSLSIESFEKRDGWSLWSRGNRTMFSAFQNSAEDFGDNYLEYGKIDEEEFFEIEIKPSIDNFEDFESVETFLKDKKEIWEEIDKMEEDEIVITLYGDYCDTIKQTSMSFSHDTRNYIIGLI